MRRSSRIIAFVAFIVITQVLVATSRADSNDKAHFDIPAEALDKALREFAVQANCNIAYEPTMLTTGVLTPVVKGEYTKAEVLSLLLKGSTLTAVDVDGETVHIVSEKSPISMGSSAKKKQRAEVLEPERSIKGQDVRQASLSDTAQTRDKDLQEVTVTGTHIRGEADSSSPVEVYTRDDIDATGATTVQQFLQTLPQNFNGGATENSVSGLSGSGQSNNQVNGSAPNLRGLGADATLVLIDGHRVAPGNSDGGFVDVSMIPLSAIERVEIVTDGASAIYGSDAVGGVVNFILRKKFDGEETRLEYGSGTNGSPKSIQAGQTVGRDWGSGSALMTYQYFDQGALSAGDRNYLRSILLPFTVLPEQVEHAVFVTFNQKLNERSDLHGDFIYSHRGTDTAISFNDGIQNISQDYASKIDGYSSSLTSTTKLANESELAVSATYSESDTLQETYQTPMDSPLLYETKTKSVVISLDGNLDGTLGSFPAGPLRYAVGGQFRKETFGNTYLVPETNNSFYPSRHVDAGYVELRIPILADASAASGSPALQITVADRGEHYSDFGSTNNPQVGITWKPARNMAIRGTYGTSFKAPLLSQLNPVPFQVSITPAYMYTPAPGGTLNTLSVYGGNPNLRPEKATSWTLGIDFNSAAVSGLMAKLTFYDIVFKDQIAVAGESICECDAYLDAATLGPAILQKNPPAALVESLIAQPSYVNFYGLTADSVGAIFDSRSMNLSKVNTRGLDVRLSLKESVGPIRVETGVDGTYVLKLDDQFDETAPVASILNTEFNPTKIRLRARATAAYGGANVGMYVNYVNGYTNNGVAPDEHVASWTTVDAVVSYKLDAASHPFNGLLLSLGVTNLLNKEPPFLSNPYSYGVNYDGANANALGRFVTLHFQKRW